MKWTTVAIILLAAICSLAITFDIEDETTFAQKLWDNITGYNTWQVAPGTNRMMPDQAPHGRFATIYANAIAVEALVNNSEVMPDGSVFAKDNFDSVKKLSHVTVMAKKRGAWFWAVYDTDGKVERAGALEGCISCHSGAPRDMVFIWPQPAQ